MSAMFIKCAILLTMLRVTHDRYHKITLWIVIAVAIITGLIGVIGGLTVCHPIEKNWDPKATAAECAYGAVLVIGFVVTALIILTDFACAVLPILVLWNMQMDRKTKVMTWCMLAFGAT
jgi:RsiW-degrading membrane proteinase PrsW (M82 family)